MVPFREPERAIAQDAAAQAAMALEPFARTGSEREIHPVAGFAFLHAEEAHTLNFKSLTDERIQIRTSHESIAARGLRLGVGQIHLPA